MKIDFRSKRSSKEYEIAILFDKEKHRDSINKVMKMLIERKIRCNSFNFEGDLG